MNKIKLTKGKFALVDDSDYEWLSVYKWCSSHGYAVSRVPGGGGRIMSMHRLIMDAKEGQFVDHINMDPCDNRRENLRVCTKAENMRNRGPQKNNSSGHKGVGWDSQRSKWKVQLRADDRSIMKRFKELEDAVKFYQEIAFEIHGDFARIVNKN